MGRPGQLSPEARREKCLPRSCSDWHEFQRRGTELARKKRLERAVALDLQRKRLEEEGVEPLDLTPYSYDVARRRCWPHLIEVVIFAAPEHRDALLESLGRQGIRVHRRGVGRIVVSDEGAMQEFLIRAGRLEAEAVAYFNEFEITFRPPEERRRRLRAIAKRVEREYRRVWW